jgi:Tfp pilus assembly protein PilO
MKRRWLSSLNPRQRVVFQLVATVVVAAAILWNKVLPAYQEWQASADVKEAAAFEYAKLQNNLSMKQTVEELSRTLGQEVYQAESDEICLSKFLRDLEAMTRRPGLVLINAKPLPVENHGSYKTYKVRLTMNGKLDELVRFVAQMCASRCLIGLESFSLRGMQGGESVECALSIWTVRLMPDAPKSVKQSTTGMFHVEVVK